MGYKKIDLKNSNSLPKIILYLVSNSALSYILLLAVSILIFRNVNRDHYGLYIVLLSIFSIINLFMAGYNQSIARFLKDDNVALTSKRQIVLGVLYYKYISLFLLISAIFLLKKYGLLEYLINDYHSIRYIIDDFFLVISANTVVSLLTSVSASILTALYSYRTVLNTDIIKNSVYLLAVSVMIFYTDNYLYYIYLLFILNCIVMAIYWAALKNKHSAYSLSSIIKLKIDFKVYKMYLYPYAVPLTASSLMTYVKNQLPLIILGREFSLDSVAIYSIIKKTFKGLHSITGSFLEVLTSKMVNLKEDGVKFSVIINRIYYGMLSSRIFIYLFIILLMSVFFSIYSINDVYVNRVIVYILGLEFVVAGMMTVYGLLLQLRRTTKTIMHISIARFVFELTLIVTILTSFGILAASLIFLLSRFLETLLSVIALRGESVIKFGVYSVLGIVPFVVYASIVVLM